MVSIKEIRGDKFMLYAKSNPIESIEQHTNELLKNLEILKQTYGDKIEQNQEFEKERFWELLKIICTYHDIGKVYTPFQNEIRKNIGLEEIKTEFNYKEIKHEQLSPLFIPSQEMGLSKEEKKLIYQAIFYHHERKNSEIDENLVQEIIDKDILPRIKEMEEELKIEINPNPKRIYLNKVREIERITKKEKIYKEYCLLKGLLHRLDHSSSAHITIENEGNQKLSELTEEFMQKSGFKLNDLQEFTKENSENNLVVIGSTGMGKTEAALLWSKSSKTFFTLPIRISINAIFDRIITKIGYEDVGLLHSTALDYLEEKQEFENEENIYEQTKNLSKRVTTCTIDQIFPFVFKYKGYEKMYATLSYSKIIIDEVQAYSPEIVAIILKGLEMIHEIGGKFMIMTATLPRIYKEKLEEMGIDFQYQKFIKNTKRHKIKLEDKEIEEDLEKIIEKGKKEKVLIIVNTVDKAIELYQKMSEQEVNVKLLHSRFIQKDRSEKENEIKNFSKNRQETGIWITTQIVEASLDIDFDSLYTEISTLDSLFQRMGRCFRSREYDKEEDNIHIYSKNPTGVGKNNVYNFEIVNKGIEMLQPYDGKILEEEDKILLVDKLYSEENLKETKFLQQFKDSMKVLNNIIDYDIDKKEAQKLLRSIENVTVIPKRIYEENIEIFEKYEKEKDCTNRNKIKREIKKLTTTISKKKAGILKEYISEIPYLKGKNDIICIDLKYDKESGLILEPDKDYELEEKFCD
ncbi:MAG: CRISPR-associated helicase Cas3' [Clostridia bacterium]